MTARAFLEFSAVIDRGCAAAALLAVVAIGLRALIRAPRETLTTAVWERFGARGERLLLAGILGAAALVRCVGWNSGLTPNYVFADAIILWGADLLEHPAAWRERVILHVVNGLDQLPQSALLIPVAAAVQAAIGASLHLSVLTGAVFGLASVLVAWWLGREIESRVFGLLFASFVAVSPLQITWSRLGYIVMAGEAHLLLVLALAYAAGKRASPCLGLLAAGATWGTLYQYYAARIAIPLAFVALGAGLTARRPRLGQSLAVVAVFVGLLGACYASVRPEGPAATGWLGSEPAVVKMARNLPLALRVYFWEQRVTATGPTALTAGMEAGGLVLAPVALLGFLGTIRCLVAPVRRAFWLVLPAAALVGPTLSAVTARRLLYFDLAWCALAAHGMIVLLDSRLVRAVSARAAAVATVAMLAALGSWSFAAIVLLNRTIPEHADTMIPFGESGAYDGRTCPACLRAAHRWQQEIAAGRFVVMFDTDVERENATMPSGLPLYGEIAALSAGRRKSFVDFYAVMQNSGRVLPRFGPLYGRDIDFVSFLSKQINQARPSAIVWDFEVPNAWERWLAGRLELAGGRRSDLGTSRLRDTVGLASVARGGRVQVERVPETARAFVVVTPQEREEAAIEVLHELAEKARPWNEKCVQLEEKRTVRLEVTGPLVLDDARAPEGEEPPDWTIGSGAQVSYRGIWLQTPTVAALGHIPGDGDRVHVLAPDGGYIVRDASGAVVAGLVPTGWPVGRGCAVRLADGWWAVDPISGALYAPSRTPAMLPRGDWMGIGRLSEHEVVLASGGQEIVVYDTARGIETARFPAAVWPTPRMGFRDCALIAAGDDFIGTVNGVAKTMNLCARDGSALATLDLAALGDWINSAHGAGHFIAIGFRGELKTFKVTRVPECGRSSEHAD